MYQVDVSKRLGIAKGKYSIPDDFDNEDPFITQMFYEPYVAFV